MREPASEVDIPALCQAIGVKKENIYIVNPNILAKVDEVLDDAMANLYRELNLLLSHLLY